MRSLTSIFVLAASRRQFHCDRLLHSPYLLRKALGSVEMRLEGAIS
jgi:hypothetical protein